MTAFVESCMKTVTGSAVAVARRTRGRPRARQLLRALAGKKNILITTHAYPDPDAMASSLALCKLLSVHLPDAKTTISVKGGSGGGLNEMFAKLTELNPTPWDDAALANFDGIIVI